MKSLTTISALPGNTGHSAFGPLRKMKQFYLLLLVKVVSGSLVTSFDRCFSQNGLLDGKNLVYYSERCRSFKKALSCMSEAVYSPYISLYERYAATGTINRMKTNVGKSCALARVQYCSATYLKKQMKGCVFGFSTFSLDNITKEYAKSHYGSLVTSLNCMTRKLQICPDDEHIRTYEDGIQTWRSQLDQLANRGPGFKVTYPRGPGWKMTTTYGPGFKVTYPRGPGNRVTYPYGPGFKVTYPRGPGWKMTTTYGAPARVQYCSATYLKEQMKECGFDFSTFSLDNITKEYAKSHYGSLITALNCMTRKLQICPDDDHIRTFKVDIQIWRSQLDQLAQKSPGWKRTTTYAHEWTFSGGTMHFSISPIVLTTLLMVVF